MKRPFLMVSIIATALSIFSGCRSAVPESGVSRTLAVERKANISSLSYRLHFNIPGSMDEAVTGSETVSLKLASKTDIVLDTRGNSIHSVTVNGHSSDTSIINEHIVIPKALAQVGANTIEISFTASNQSLNRRESLLYTLLVPDRARTLFPCFDQPNLKAKYTLSLNIPEKWVGVSNTFAASEEIKDGVKTLQFAETEPLSTYLFSFVAGEFESYSDPAVTAAGKPIHLYYRETDPEKIAQCPEVLRLVKESLDYLEDYTEIDYPFAKYDLIVLPDFQYGGMEHTGATLYNDRRIFLGAKPTTDELLSRASLIAHETAHMWFGDLVTMDWFNDVWTKEVFANWFAGKMVRPVYPEINHDLSDLKSYTAAAYTEDRTIGSNAIQRPLDNLSNAGLIYCNIIYDKSPVMMEMLAKRMGYDKFRLGICDYLKRFAYSNATWDDLIVSLGQYADFDLEEWSRVWVKEKGMPIFRTAVDGKTLTISQEDPFNVGNLWQEDLEYTMVGAQGETASARVSFTDRAEMAVSADFDIVYAIPNTDAAAYGRFVISPEDALYMMSIFPSVDNENRRMSLLMTLYENVWHKDISGEEFINWICKDLRNESNSLIQSSMMSYAADVASKLGKEGAAGHKAFEDLLYDIASDPSIDHEFRLLAFRRLVSEASGDTADKIYGIWEQQKPFAGLSIGENDYTSMAYQLMLRFPEKAADIRTTQLERISNIDRQETFCFISQAVSADKTERDAFFNSLLSKEGRTNESRVRSAMGLLNNSLREAEAVAYIRPALDVIEDIQRTGDIFFPANWSAALLGGHSSDEAKAAVEGFIADNNDLNPLLMTKVLQAAGWLLQ